MCIYIGTEYYCLKYSFNFQAVLLLFQFNYQESKQYYACNKDLLIAIAKVFNNVRGKLICGKLCPVGGINTNE